MRRENSSRIPDAFIDEVLSRTDIEAVIGARVPLKKAGASLVACCPFHTEKSPSFTVSATKGFYHCFGCGASGSALTFLIEHDGTPFRDAIAELASMAGLSLPTEPASTATAPPPDFTALYQVNAQAYRWFRHTLKTDEVAKNYLRSRGVNQDTLRRFLIGSAPDEWQGLRTAFPDYETNQALHSTGLVRVNEEKSRRYDAFRARIIFGIRDPRGRIVGFGGRSIAPSDSAKYINSPESPIFDKSSTLFGIFEARESIRKEKFAFVTEGYMDVAMMSQYGVSNAVAGMGTAFTSRQAERLLTQTKSVVFCFDGDKAGKAAALKACKVMLPMLEEELDIRVLVLPGGQDPDEMLRNEGRDAFMALARSSPSMGRHILVALTEVHDITTPEGKARFVNDASNYIALISSSNLRSGYEQELRVLAGQSSLAALSRTERPAWANNTQPSLWQRIALCAAAEPGSAVAHRDEIIACLDDESVEERALIAVLQALTVDAPSTADAEDRLLAQDLLAGAVLLIADERQLAFDQAIKAQYLNNEIDINAYMEISMRT